MGRRAVIVAVLTGLLIAVPGVSWALWRANDTMETTTVTAGVVAPPTDVSCDYNPGIILLGLGAGLDVTWSAPQSGPEPSSYQVRLSGGGNTQTIDVDDGTSHFFPETDLLWLGSLLDLLLTGRDDLTASVWAVHESGWTSDPVSDDC